MSAVPGLETFTRLGFAARGVLYVMVGYLAIEAGRNTSSAGALRTLADSGPGKLALFVIALGLLAYGAWRYVEAALDLEGAGRDTKGAVKRIGGAVSGVVHVGLGLLAAGLVFGIGASGGAGGGGEEAATARLLGLPGGGMLVRLLAWPLSAPAWRRAGAPIA
jgi:hypothetical protein